MPLAVYLLGAAIFAQGTSELMLTGLLPDIAAEFRISVPVAALQISAFAFGMIVGAPLLTIVTLRWSRRNTMIGLLLVFIAGHVAGALATGPELLMATRVLTAFVYAGFWAVSGATAIALAGPGRSGRAMSVVTGGLTVAMVAGLPLGTLLGQHLGWRGAFWAVAVASAVALAGVWWAVPADRPATAALPDPRRELRAVADGRLWLSLTLTASFTAALLALFAFLSPMLTEVYGLAPGWVPAVLALYGAATVLGIWLGGRLADTRPYPVLFVSVGGVIAVGLLLPWTTGLALPGIALIVLFGGFGFLANPVLSARVVAIAPEAPVMSLALNTSAFNVGITVGPWIGGLVISGGFGYPALAWAVVGLGALSLAALCAARLAGIGGRDRTAQPAPVPVA
ncbi:DHA1 family chloramphenicol resistance protein-like MFS transporter [Stackebrandtia albiflava]|uniref:DHA1 family chloramphenicol resistance protein-like MFS transporter n=1 Tax=Stackebrandtia albiflava TaxID=406432 RepID=A0A562V325_9ACTN|nr:Cmx/CmrA family chloramphenicol efflux MFS transporter [Stackebrandtia albiflava]TWJ12207.1 DHA1 family chloramphenicol resistance protein-like MFS transporter [Stackebrandtia albiflava]